MVELAHGHVCLARLHPTPRVLLEHTERERAVDLNQLTSAFPARRWQIMLVGIQSIVVGPAVVRWHRLNVTRVQRLRMQSVPVVRSEQVLCLF